MDGRLTLFALVIAIAAWAGSLIAVWPTWQGMNHSTGDVAALADAALHGEAPGLARGDAFLGTLNFPPVPLLTAAAKHTGISWRAAIRWVNLLGALALMAAVAVAAQALGGSGVAITVSLALLIVSAPFASASLAGRSDPFAAALSIGALAAWCRDPRRRGWRAPALAAAAWLVDPAALTTPFAVLIASFGPGARRAAGPFAARFFTAVAAGVVLSIPWHGPGWYADAFATLVVHRPYGFLPLRGPFELLRDVASAAELAVLFALAIVFLIGEWSRGRPVRPFAVASLVLATIAMSSRGSDENLMLELTAVAAIGAGMWAERATRREAALGTALVLIAVCGAAWRGTEQLGGVRHRPEARRDQVIEAIRSAPGPVLSEDPLLALAAGGRAEVADAAALQSRLRHGDPRAVQFVARLNAGRYALAVLDRDLADERPSDYRDFAFGPAVAAALEARYRAGGEVDGYSLRWLQVASAPAPTRVPR
jgi:hypothetical protein